MPQFPHHAVNTPDWVKHEHEFLDPLAGVHVCGANFEDNYCFTQARFPGATRERFEMARAKCAVGPDEPSDFLVDFFTDRHTYDDQFPTTRQMLGRLAAIMTGGN